MALFRCTMARIHDDACVHSDHHGVFCPWSQLMGCPVQETVDEQRRTFSDKEILVLEKIVEKAANMVSLKEEDDDDNADADVSWIHKKV